MSLPDTGHRLFIEETIDLVRAVMGASWLVFYRVDSRRDLGDFLYRGVPAEARRLYEREMFAYDPLHVRRIEGEGSEVARLADADRYAPAADVRRYTRFLRRHRVVDALELVFRKKGAILAGLNVSWTERDPSPTVAASHSLAKQLQRYIEFNLIHRLDQAGEMRLEAARMFHLTAREREVAALVCHGHTNHEIAMHLGVRPSTVKSHMIHIFEKCAVDNRAGLVGCLNDPASAARRRLHR